MTLFCIRSLISCSAAERVASAWLVAMDERYAKAACDGVKGGGRNTGRRWLKCDFGNDKVGDSGDKASSCLEDVGEGEVEDGSRR